MLSKPELREKQVEQLAFYLREKKCLDQSHPGTGKTPPVCVLAYYVWARENHKTLWSMPKSLLRKNQKEMYRFTEFEPGDVVILRTDRADLTKNWEGPTINSTRRTATFRLRDGSYTHLMRHGPPSKRLELLWVNKKGETIVLRTGKVASAEYDEKKVSRYVVEPALGPDDKPIREYVDVPETFKDLIADASGAKVFICTFSFMSEHWERVLEANPDIDLLLVDELHMAYGNAGSKQTESFFWVNRNVTRFVGMTGTLINGRLDSAYPAISVIEPRYYGSLGGFMFEHAAVVDDYGRVIVWKNEPKLRQILEKHSIRRTFEEVYGSEDVVFFTEYVEVGEQVREAYDEFHERAMLELEDGRILDGALPGVNLIRARQILAHPETMLKNIPKLTPKDERLQVHLATGKKALIFAALKPEQERIVAMCKELGLRAALINSDYL